MGIDYYGVLNLKRNCQDLDIKRAFRRAAIQFHPQRHKDKSALEVFTLIAEAYDALQDPYRRAVYDQFGEEGLKEGWQGPCGEIKPYTYHGDPFKTYREFFGTESPYADLLDEILNPLTVPASRGKKIADEIRKPLLLTLEEVFHGGLKKVRILRRVFVGPEKNVTEPKEDILKIPIKPGILPGTEFRFPEMGDQSPAVVSADVVFVTEDIPHERFRREGVNLITCCNVDLKSALVGCTVQVNTLDGRVLRVPLTEIIKPEYEKVVHGEGMPHLTDNKQRGDLILRFNVEYPKYLPKSSKELISKAIRLSMTSGEKGDPDHVYKMIMRDKMNRILPYT